LQGLTTAWELFKDSPWAGIGVGNFIKRSVVGAYRPMVVHNAYLEVLVSTGVFGLLAYLGMFISGARHCWAGAFDRRGSATTRTLSYYVGVFLLSTMVSGVFLSIHFKYFMWLPLAMALALGNVLRRSR
jgi:O-antigen ligase